MKIRRLLPEDTKIGVAAIENIKGTSTTSAVVTQFLSRPDQYFIAAMEDDRPVGFALAYELQRIDRPHPMLFLYEIEVIDSYRQKGIATAMIDLLKGICHENRACKMFVSANAANTPALRLYDSTFEFARKTEDIVYTLPLVADEPAEQKRGK